MTRTQWNAAAPVYWPPKTEREPRAGLILNRYTKQHTIILASRFSTTFFGLEESQLIGQPFTTVVHPAYEATVQAALQEVKSKDSLTIVPFVAFTGHDMTGRILWTRVEMILDCRRDGIIAVVRRAGEFPSMNRIDPGAISKAVSCRSDAILKDDVFYDPMNIPTAISYYPAHISERALDELRRLKEIIFSEQLAISSDRKRRSESDSEGDTKRIVRRTNNHGLDLYGLEKIEELRQRMVFRRKFTDLELASQSDNEGDVELSDEMITTANTSTCKRY